MGHSPKLQHLHLSYDQARGTDVTKQLVKNANEGESNAHKERPVRRSTSEKKKLAHFFFN